MEPFGQEWPEPAKRRCKVWPDRQAAKSGSQSSRARSRLIKNAIVRGLPDDRQGIGFDTNLFIYFLEDHPRYGVWCASLFDRIERGRNPAVTSTVTLLELLAQPYRDQKEELAQKIFALTSTYPQIEWVPVTLNLADRAAELRARSGGNVFRNLGFFLEETAICWPGRRNDSRSIFSAYPLLLFRPGSCTKLNLWKN